MVPRSYRLRGRSRLERVLRDGRRARSGLIQVAALREAGGDKARESPKPYEIGVVTTRGFKNAVSRNRARRRALGAVWRSREILENGWSYVLIVRPGVDEMPKNELDRQVAEALQRATSSRGSVGSRNSGGGRGISGGEGASGKAGRKAMLSVGLIRLYQKTLSPLLGAHCRYYPSCSEYAIDALREYGAIRGWLMAGRRVLRCHPWAPGGYDPVIKPWDR